MSKKEWSIVVRSYVGVHCPRCKNKIWLSKAQAIKLIEVLKKSIKQMPYCVQEKQIRRRLNK